jgi:CRP-like cAMP-binding protein
LSQHDYGSILEFLKQGAWFSGLPEGLQALIMERSIVRSYRRREFIIRQGTPTKGMFAVLEGRVRVVSHIGNGEEVLLHIGEAGLWFGEYAMLSGSGTRSIGSIIADTPVRALLLPVAEFERIVEDEPRHFRAVADLMLERYPLLYRYASEAQGFAAEERLRSRLQGMASMERSSVPGRDAISVSVSQADLATIVGVSRQTLNVLLARLEARGLIEIGFRCIRVLDETRLHKQGEGKEKQDDEHAPARPRAPVVRVANARE